MPWIMEKSVEEVRKEFCFKAFKSNESFTKICRNFGISNKTGYKWLKRFEEEGAAGLEDRPKVAKNIPIKIPPIVRKRLLKLKDKHKTWGGKKIQVLYKKKFPGEYVPHRSTIEELFKKEGLTKRRRRKRSKLGESMNLKLKPTKPNELWTVDFKGWWWTSLKERCEPLTVRDEFSKFILVIDVPDKGDIYCVKKVFEALFRRYGLPEYIRSDNGPPFGNMLNMWGLTKLSVWWMALGIKIDRSDPGHPEQNGAHERMHRDMKKELQNKISGDLKQHKKVFEKWRKEFNEIRPHEALGMKTPKELYKKSERKYIWDGLDIEIEYGGRMKSRMVNSRGYIHYKNQHIFLGNPFNGYNVGIKERSGKWTEVWFDNFKLGEINPVTLQIEAVVVNYKEKVA